MKKEDIKPGDWYRILFGETPVEFMLEILLRTLIIYTVLLVIVRFMGKRMGGQLTISELAVMVTLGAIVSPGMQMPQTGLLVCTVILICALIFQKGLNRLEYNSSRFEKISQGTLTVLVRNGIIQVEEMARTKVSREQLYAALRGKSIYNLGEIDRVYLEACGIFSIYSRQKPAPGLLLFPSADSTIGAYAQQKADGVCVCAYCGKVSDRAESQEVCPECGKDEWKDASISYLAETEQQEQ
ncbi:DUF421 domain-containing protein [Dyadobacter sandarakinus]|uniref:DUF421 domain-containing protein n=1 Tax=Dyadobacter sandarakinus TaxID=2747268 RepID=A0ABX7I506_9BACT|nr:YetF domain-containing protein [Dyadobacter sandarakinus]QRR00303.1 DUF421 domain-containing protein [Dyadobacter sandarakinus]